MRRIVAQTAWRAALVIGLATLLAGCASDGTDSLRMERWRPDDSGRNPWEWADPDTAVGSRTDPGAGEAAGTNAAPADGTSRVLQRGNKVEIALLGIPGSQVLSDKLDDQGYINLPHIGKVRLEGTTPSEAKVLIERAYIDGGIFRRIDVSVVAEAYSYYVGGEVKQPGKYVWSANMTLLRAIAAAGDYTEYARRSRVDIIRSGEKVTYHTGQIEDLKIPDPHIKPNDRIKVHRRIL